MEGLSPRRFPHHGEDLVTDLTSPEIKAKEHKYSISLPVKKSKGTGRPTKKQRRALDEFLYTDS